MDLDPDPFFQGALIKCGADLEWIIFQVQILFNIQLDVNGGLQIELSSNDWLIIRLSHIDLYQPFIFKGSKIL